MPSNRLNNDLVRKGVVCSIVGQLLNTIQEDGESEEWFDLAFENFMEAGMDDDEALDYASYNYISRSIARDVTAQVSDVMEDYALDEEEEEDKNDDAATKTGMYDHDDVN